MPPHQPAADLHLGEAPASSLGAAPSVRMRPISQMPPHQPNTPPLATPLGATSISSAILSAECRPSFPGGTRVVGNLRRPPKTCHSSSERWENGDSEYVIRYAGKIRPFLKFQYLCNIRNYFFWPDLRRLPSQQTPNIWYVLVANMLEINPVVQNISEIHLRLHKLRCILILTLHIQHGSHSPPPAASL